MKHKFVTLLKKNKKLFFIANIFHFLQTSSLMKIDGSKKKYPKVIQLPITYNCNSKCIMCNVWKMDHSNEATIEEFSRFIQDPLFKKVEAVGINGGEPSLIKNLPEYVNEILKLPRLKSLNIISHGFGTKPLLKIAEIIYKNCQNKGVRFHIAISLDGVGDIHNTVRGRPKVFEKTTATIDAIIKDQSKYCDSYDIGCTIVNKNIHYLIELSTYARKKNYNIKYRLGIENKRIESDKLIDQYSVLYNPLRQCAKEFFHFQISQEKNLTNRFKYYAIFFWLNSKQPKRLLGCAWKDEGITLDSRGTLFYCAVSSNKIGSLRQDKGEKIFFADENINYRKTIISDSCDHCIHDYTGKPELQNTIKFLIYMLIDRYALRLYQLKVWFMS